MTALVMVTAALAATAPFEWEVRLDGKIQPMAELGSLDPGLEGWTCGWQVDPLLQTADETSQMGVLACDAASGQVADTLVLCMTRSDRPADHGAGNLVLEQGDREVALEMSCSTPGHASRPRMQLEPDTQPTDHLGIPDHRSPRTPGTFLWQITLDDSALPIDEPGPVPQDNAAWTCSQQVSGVTDPTYGYAEHGTLTCNHAGTSVTTSVPA